MITTEQIKSIASEFGIDWKLIQAFILTESSGAGFSKDGKVKIQFEPHVFRRYTGITIENKVDVQSKEWEAYEKAYSIDSESAMLSTSWGLMQVMGFNYKICGYDSVGRMVGEMKISELYQVKAGIKYILHFPRLVAALKAKDWHTVARMYNGPKYQEGKYHIKFETNYNKIA
jgi:hypothetical protein